MDGKEKRLGPLRASKKPVMDGNRSQALITLPLEGSCHADKMLRARMLYSLFSVFSA
ncbi:hypothetical protein [Geobacillus zalihae]|uniref:hypothetical protein n=1 Tax=Geobacillus zalihae TaxID=213419 RepID=UPI00186113D2|nr:hypothetical protein [Geobacillus zalihae]QNU26469.1 hypothetical protein IC806_07820 [Geobacillus zalihae]